MTIKRNQGGDSIKTFVLDTSVLLYDPLCILKFKENNVHIPLVVVEELDRFKKDHSENGRNARHFSRIVDNLRKEGSLADGVALENGGKLRISVDSRFKTQAKQYIDLSTNDNVILGQALSLKEDGQKVIVISKDINLRLKADALGLESDDYRTRETTFEDLYSGERFFDVDAERYGKFEKERFLAVTENDLNGLYPNEYLIVRDKNNHHRRLLGRYCASKKGIIPLIKVREGVWGIYPKNVEQQFAMDALLNNEVKLVSLVGKAGTGKTLLAIAAGLELAITEQKFSRVLVSRPIMPMGRDLGFLPGDVNEKLGPWMQPIFDNLDYLFGDVRTGNNEAGASWEQLVHQGLLHVEPLTYIRGRSIPKQYMIVDEAQNLSPHEIKTIITRAGEGTKIVLTGDCEQIDNPYLDSINNGLAYIIERLKSEPIVAHSTLRVGERSELSEIASKLL